MLISNCRYCRAQFFLRSIVWGKMFCFSALFLLFFSCSKKEQVDYNITILDNSLSLELIAQAPDIMTPVGMVIDDEDAIYILESHTHSPKTTYKGPKFDRIKKGIDENKDGIPERWVIFADSIEDGMNLANGGKYGIFLTTKNSVSLYIDSDANGISDDKKILVEMVEPDYVYDHAGILGIALGNDGWVYISRGNTGGSYWVLRGTDGSKIEGYGDGGNVFRCKLDGSELEEIATGFWNPFDLKFTADGRLFVTDNDPDSRGPNRLVEIVPGGDYGYKSLYGGSGIHPYLSWNGELPGTLPYAAPLGEAPCAMIDASYTNFGDEYLSEVLVNVWEEKNIVRIPLKSDGSTVKGKPDVLVQGDSLFHPVALSTNSRGELYITDWVMRQYPNHGEGRLWRISSKTNAAIPSTVKLTPKRFKTDERTVTQLVTDLTQQDVFEQSIARYYLAKRATADELVSLLNSEDSRVRLQALLIFFDREEILEIADTKKLLSDENADIRKMTLIYIGRKGLTTMQPELFAALRDNSIESDIFETFLATIRHLQPKFIKGVKARSVRSSELPRELPIHFIKNILSDPTINETVKSMALPYLGDFEFNSNFVLGLLKTAKEEPFQIALINAARYTSGTGFGDVFKEMVFNQKQSDKTRAMALMALSYLPEKYFEEIFSLLKTEKGALQYAAIKYLCLSPKETPVLLQVQQWIESDKASISETALSVWNRYQVSEIAPGKITPRDSIGSNGDHRGANAEIGRLIYENRASLCVSCHKINGWGGAFGPELSKIASSKSRWQLVDAILEPSKEISPEWQGWFLVDQEGVRHTGRQIDVNGDFAELMNINGEYYKFKYPKSYGVLESSVMPDGLEKGMTLNEFNDLIAYLLSLK